MQRRHLRREYVSFRHIGNQNPTKAGIPLCRYRHIFSPTVSPCLAKGKQSSLPYPLTSTKPAFTAALPFAVWRLDIKYLLFVLLTSAVRSVILSA